MGEGEKLRGLLRHWGRGGGFERKKGKDQDKSREFSLSVKVFYKVVRKFFVVVKVH